MITPQVGELESESTIEMLRAHFQALFEQPLPRQVVVNLEYVAHLSAQAIGVLLAHHLRLDRAGGACGSVRPAPGSWPSCTRSD